ncbi:allantoinase PuuE [Aestuariibacter sp. AA17]|uniref:Allantoinase PuuE n=1 Tax=Fluctibacter corallii TaxID=2984329 RepID=A0ABT3A6D3_9ALTE|nr:allantoinase PuuE [Aestuariibacter sp. AA17]MCV2884226.1 allantoinase PuuE [Aestuariibacter sp. AA17]
MQAYPRDLIGYGGKPVHPKWPNQARIAVQFVLNYEEGGEYSVLHGDAHSETFLSDIAQAEPYTSRHLSMESLYEYGSRAGFWRIHDTFVTRKLPLTVFAVTMAMQRNPDVVEAIVNANWEIASHGMRWIHYQNMEKAKEAQHIEASVQLHQAMLGEKPTGWYTGRTSPHTLALLAERDDILYCSDSYADDLPYYDNHYSKPLLMIPYTLDVNDMRFVNQQGFCTSNHFYTYLRDSFDVLYDEGETCPKMLSIGLHCRIIGHPGRFAGLKRFLDYIAKKDKVWVCTREEIARHWLQHFPYKQEG